MAKIEDAYAAPRDLVLVSRSDPAAGRANLLARRAFAVEHLVIRHDEMRPVAHVEAARDVHPVGDQLLDLLEERVGIEYHPITDRTANPGMENPATVSECFLSG